MPRPPLFLPQYVARYGARTNMPLSHVIGIDVPLHARAPRVRHDVVDPEHIDACLTLGFVVDGAIIDLVGSRTPRGLL